MLKIYIINCKAMTKITKESIIANQPTKCNYETILLIQKKAEK